MSQMSLNNLSFIYPKHTLKINDFLIPILIDVSNIYYNQFEELKIGLIGIEDELSYEYEKLKVIDRFKNTFIHINIKDKLFDNFTKNFLEYYKLNTLNDLFYILSDYDMLKIINHISQIIPSMIKIFRDRLYAGLKLDIKEPVISVKDENPMTSEIKEYLSYTELYILAQSVIEYNATPFFPENKKKTVSEWSIREYELHLSYLTIKSRFENIQNKWQIKYTQSKTK